MCITRERKIIDSANDSVPNWCQKIPESMLTCCQLDSNRNVNWKILFKECAFESLIYKTSVVLSRHHCVNTLMPIPGMKWPKFWSNVRQFKMHFLKIGNIQIFVLIRSNRQHKSSLVRVACSAPSNYDDPVHGRIYASQRLNGLICCRRTPGSCRPNWLQGNPKTVNLPWRSFNFCNRTSAL